MMETKERPDRRKKPRNSDTAVQSIFRKLGREKNTPFDEGVPNIPDGKQI